MRKEHRASVQAVAFSADGRLLASGSEDQTIMVWDMPALRPCASLKGHRFGVNAVAFSPFGRRVASGGEDGYVRVWNISGEGVWTGYGHCGGVNAVAFTDDGRWLVSGGGQYGEAGEIKIWDMAHGRVQADVTGHLDEVLSLAIAPQRRLLASADYEGFIRLWDLRRDQVQPLLKWPGHWGAVWCVAFDPSGQRLVSVGEDGILKLWEASGGGARLRLQARAFGALSAAFSPDGSLLAVARFDGVTVLLDAGSGHFIATLGKHAGPAFSVAYAPNGNSVATGSRDRTVALWTVPHALVESALAAEQDWQPRQPALVNPA
jgi:WD40 repeat protein